MDTDLRILVGLGKEISRCICMRNRLVLKSGSWCPGDQTHSRECWIAISGLRSTGQEVPSCRVARCFLALEHAA